MTSFLVAVRVTIRHGQLPAKGLRANVSHRILIVDDSPVIRRSLRSCIEQNTESEVCGEAENGAIAVERVLQLKPDLVILDLQMPTMDGFEAARRIRRLTPETVLVMFTMYECRQVLEDARAAGIEVIFSKSDSGPDRLVTYLKSLLPSASAPA
ncbi:MAG TPA: response regulator transcription factor [Terriglobales bacterium]|nr:response regulator transcription factor [Terriglobales bacterium]